MSELRQKGGKWVDKRTHWAWVGGPEGFHQPTEKTLDYVTINKGTPVEQRLCIGVWDGSVYTPLHRDELEFHTKQL